MVLIAIGIITFICNDYFNYVGFIFKSKNLVNQYLISELAFRKSLVLFGAYKLKLVCKLHLRPTHGIR